MVLGVAGEIVGSDILDRPFVDIAGRDDIFAYEIAQPAGAVGIDLVVVGAGLSHQNSVV